MTGSEDTAYTFSVADFTAGYAQNDGASFTAVRVDSLPTNGTLTLADQTTAVTVGDVFTIAQLNAGEFVFTANANLNSPVTTFGFDFAARSGSVFLAAKAVSVDVTAVNDAPTFTAGATLSAVNEDTSSPTGSTVTTLLSAKFTDVENGNFAGIAVSANTAASGQGSWQYSTDGTNWFAIGSVSATGALLLEAASSVRFVPALNFNGTPTPLTVFAVDDSSSTIFTNGTTRRAFDTTTDDVTSKVSTTGVNISRGIA